MGWLGKDRCTKAWHGLMSTGRSHGVVITAMPQVGEGQQLGNVLEERCSGWVGGWVEISVIDQESEAHLSHSTSWKQKQHGWTLLLDGPLLKGTVRSCFSRSPGPLGAL